MWGSHVYLKDCIINGGQWIDDDAIAIGRSIR